MKSVVKFLSWLVLLLVAMFVLLAWINNVSTSLSEEDVRSLQIGFGINRVEPPKTFEEEIDYIREVQRRVFLHAPVGAGIPDGVDREPVDLLAYKQGLCYDRSRTIDKALKWGGLESRHVYILYRGDKSFFEALSTYRSRSHAITEVKTKKGWMIVDSNTPWISLNRNGDPVSADEVFIRIGEFESPPPYMADAYWSIPGLYSRRGQLFRPFFPFPDLSWYDFTRWAFGLT